MECHIFALCSYVKFVSNIFFYIDTVQMHNSTTDTIKDTYYFFNTADFDNLHVWIFFLLLDRNMLFLHLSIHCPTDWFRHW